MIEDRAHGRPPREFPSLPPCGVRDFEFCADTWSAHGLACGRRRDNSDLNDERPGTGRSTHTDRRSAGEDQHTRPGAVTGFLARNSSLPTAAPGALRVGNKTLRTAPNLGRCSAMLSAKRYEQHPRRRPASAIGCRWSPHIRPQGPSDLKRRAVPVPE